MTLFPLTAYSDRLRIMIDEFRAMHLNIVLSVPKFIAHQKWDVETHYMFSLAISASLHCSI